MKLSDILILIGLGAIVLVNPLTGQYLIKAIIFAYEQLLLVSDWFMVAGITLIGVGFILNKQEQRKKHSAKFKKLKNKKTQVAGEFID